MNLNNFSNKTNIMKERIDDLYIKIQNKEINYDEAAKEIALIKQFGEIHVMLLEDLKQEIAGILGVNVSDISENVTLIEMGIDLVNLQILNRILNERYGISIEQGIINNTLSIIGLVFEMEQNFAEQMKVFYKNEESFIEEVKEDVSYSLYNAKQYVKEIISEIMKIPVNDIEEECDLDVYGINSIIILSLMERLEKDFAGLPKTLFFEYHNVQELAGYFAKYKIEELEAICGGVGEHNLVRDVTTPENIYKEIIETKQDDDVREIEKSSKGSMDIAIVGLAGSYAKARDIHEFWENLKSGRDCISEIPESRWNFNKYKSEENKKETYPHWGGFMEDIDKFDSMFFQIAPREAEKMDPQERLFLECVYKVIEDAGYTRKNIASKVKYGHGAKVGVFVGAMFEEYQFYGVEEQVNGNFRTLNGSKASLANRISYYFDFQGPSVSVDTMCSSSLTALYLACESIKKYDCEVAVVGGVNLSLHPNKYLALSEDNFLSSNGCCQSYGEGGDGYVPGEGIGAVLVKPLEAAEAAGDHIYAVIKGGAINHGGKTNGYSVPNPNAMSDLISKAIENAHVNPRTIGYVEGHGTGTSLGDPIEIAGLKKVYNEYTNERQFCSIGSVKSNIGHCEAAAGIASLTKILLQMKYKQLVPSLHSNILNTSIEFENSPFYVQHKLQNWERIVLKEDKSKEYPRRAALSSFGAGGSNAHFILEEYIPTEEQSFIAKPPFIFTLSAKSKDALKRLVEKYQSFLEKQIYDNNDLYNMEYTLLCGREEKEERLAICCESFQELLESIQDFLTGKENSKCKTGSVNVSKKQKVNKEAIRRWLEEMQFDLLAQSWVNGQEIDWMQLFEEGLPKRISLPTYSFESVSHWFTRKTVSETLLHPFIQKNVSDLSELRYECILTGEESFLKGHIIFGKKVLPAAAYLEMIREAVLESYDEDEVNERTMVIGDIVWNTPFVSDGNSTSMYIGLTLLEESKIYCEIYSMKNEVIRVHCNAIVTFEYISSEKLDLECVQNGCTQKVTEKEEIYKTFSDYGFVYHDDNRLIEYIHSGKDICIAKISAKHFITESQDVSYMEPGVLDAAIQSFIGLIHPNESNQQMMPYQLQQFKIYSKLEEDIWVVIQKESEKNEGDKVVNISLCSGSGKVCMSFKGLCYKKMVTNQKDSVTTLFIPVNVEESITIAEDQEPCQRKIVIIITDRKADLSGDWQKQYECIQINIDAEETRKYEQYTNAAVKVLEKVKQVMKEHGQEKLLIQIISIVKEEKWLFRGLSKILRTAERENPNVTGQYIEISDYMEHCNIGKYLLENAKSKSKLVTYKNQKRFVKYWRQEEDIVQDRKKGWKNGGVYLLTGGVYGLSQITMQHIASNVEDATIILTGRKSKENVRSTLDLYRQLSANIEYYEVDLTDYKNVRSVVEAILRAHHKIDGVLYGAGIIQDHYIIEKKEEEFISVLRPKTLGLENVDLATKHCDLDFFLVYSSIAGAVGNVGQVDYSCANAFMDNYMHYRNKLVAKNERHGKSYSVNWPLWKDGGMRVDEKVEHMMRKNTGIVPMESKIGMNILDKVISSALEQILVIESEDGRIENTIKALEIEIQNRESRKHFDTKTNIQKDDALEENTILYLKKIVSETTQLSLNDIKESTDFNDLGMNSIWILEINEKLEQDIGGLSKTLLYEYHCIEDLCAYLMEYNKNSLAALFQNKASHQDDDRKVNVEKDLIRHKLARKNYLFQQRQEINLSNKQGKEEIAIIGLSGRYPQAAGINEFWNNLLDGKDCITEIPVGRWNYNKYKKDDSVSYSKYGGFLEDVDKFDPLFFNISPRDAQTMDPQERLFLECAYETMQDAGYTRENIAPKIEFCDGVNVGVYVGVMYEEYQFIGIEEQMKGKPVTASGSAAAIANRVSYTFNFQGPSIAVDSMCSSSLTAVYLACEAIKNGMCDVAIAGGVNISIHANKYLALGQNYFTSEDGKCRAFGENGEGYVPGEGVGAILLKPLNQAVQDGDHIYGVIKGGAINHGGKTHGYTVPNPNAQASVIKKALEQAKVNPKTISCIEAHGTGTLLGDPIEITGLTKAYETYTNEKQYCAIGSVKSNIGHCEGAAGIAAITKVLLQMKYKKLVPSIHTKVLNRNINFADTPFYVQTELKDWKHAIENENGMEKEIPFRAGISAFGAGGTNAHLILEEYITNPVVDIQRWKQAHIPLVILLSGKSTWQINLQANNLIKMVERGKIKEENSYQVAYTLQVGREAMEQRMAFLCNSVEEMCTILKEYLRTNSNHKIVTGFVNLNDNFTKKERKIQQHMAKQALQNRDFSQLIQFWMSGVEIDWSMLYNECLPEKISLPLYPFEKEVCWIKTTDNISDNRKLQVEEQTNQLLIAYKNVSSLNRQKYEIILTGKERFFTNHVVQGKKILPAAAYMEIVRETLEQSVELDKDKECIRIEEIMWQYPIVAKDAVPVKVCITYVSVGETTISFKIYCEESSETYCTGKASVQPVMHEHVDISEVRNLCTRRSFNADVIYEMYAQFNIEYKEEHRSIRNIYIGKDVLIAEISVPKDDMGAEGKLNPGIVDCALQACVGFMLDDRKQNGSRNLSVPFQAKSIDIIMGTQSEMWAFIHKCTKHSDEKYQIDLYTKTGELCMRINELATKEFKQANNKGELITHPVWKRTDCVSVETINNSEDCIIFICNDAPKEIRYQLDGCKNVFYIYGECSQSDFKKMLLQVAHIRQVLFITEQATFSSILDDDIIERQKNGIMAFYKLICAMDTVISKDRKLDICVFTFQTVPFKNEGICDPKNAGLQGIVRTVSVEYPEWNICMCDLDDSHSFTSHFVKNMDRELNTVLLNRNGKWYRQELEKVTYPGHRKQIVYRNRGVYVIIGGNGGIGESYSRYLIERYNANVIWIGRRPMSGEISAKISEISNGTNRITYYSGDACSKESLASIYLQIKERFGRVDGVIHSAIVLADSRLSNMTEQDFEKVYFTKMKICLRMAQVFGKEDLDFMLFFSSLQAFSNAFGQGNYAAGCTFKDAYAKVISQVLSCNCKIVNWGYWGNQGIVSSYEYREKMSQLGVDSIYEEDAMKFLEKLLANPIDQVGYLKINSNYVQDRKLNEDTLNILPEITQVKLEEIQKLLKADAKSQKLKQRNEAELENMLVKMMYVILDDIGIVKNGSISLEHFNDYVKKLVPYDKWIKGTIHILQKFDILQKEGNVLSVNRNIIPDVEQVRIEWRKILPKWRRNEEISRFINAIIPVMENLSYILTGKCKAVDIIFPEGSMKLVEPIYKYDETVRYSNHKLALIVEDYMKQQISKGEKAEVSILEVGAGTGGTSYHIFEILRPYEAFVKEYCYTDVSKAFLSFAEKEYCTEFPYIRLQAYDVSNDDAGDLEGKYDIVLATNVIHATKNINQSVRNMKSLLKRNGILVVNEMIRNSVVTHLIFGLLEGWWLYEDVEVRIEDCPLLSAENWKKVFREEGYLEVTTSENMYGQELIVGKSDGCIKKSGFKIEQQEKEAIPVLENIPKNQVEEQKKHMGKELRSMTTDFVKSILSEELKISVDKLKKNIPLEKYGLDSIVITKITSKLQKEFKSVKNSLFFECQTIEAVVERLIQEEEETLRSFFLEEEEIEYALEEETKQNEVTIHLDSLEENYDDIAVIGLSGRYPNADNIKEFWDNLKNGRDSITEIPKGRWDWKKYYDEKKGKANSIYTQWGGFINEIDKFDPYFFGIVPAEAERMDPQERLFLQTVYECLEDAGYVPEKLSQQGKVGVFVGAMNGYYPGGASFWSIANRVSYLFNFHGPSFSVDSACSSSLTALHLAIQSIQKKDCESAIVGGVNLIVSPEHFMRLCTMRMLSSGNECRAFGVNADGIVDGEGIGAVLVKPLKKAVQDGDNIYAVIKGITINSGGKTNGYTIPNPMYQAEVIRKTYEKANINPETISYIEAHGTGTALGDPLEIEAISKVFSEYSNNRQFCSIGSVKTNIGHSESAAGIAALTKVLLQIRYKKLVPSLHSSQINEKIDINGTPFYVQKDLENWGNVSCVTGEVQKRRAGISSFGAGGSNAHLIIEEYIPEDVCKSKLIGRVVIALSAKSKEQLYKKAKQLLVAIREEVFTDDSLLDISYTLLEGREEMSFRLAFTVETIYELQCKLESVLAGKIEESIFILDNNKANFQLDTDTDDEMEQRINQLLETGGIEELLKIWVKGLTIDWNPLFRNKKTHRISLPTYPFEGSHYWIKESQMKKIVKPRLQELVHENCSNYRHFQFKSWFTGEEFYLADHIVQGEKIMSGATYLELVREAVEEFLPDEEKKEAFTWRFQDVIWMKALVVHEQVEVVTEIFLDEGNQIRFEVYRTGDGKEKILHCKGIGKQVRQGIESNDFQTLRQRMFREKRVSGRVCYEKFEELGLTYGPAYRAVKEVYLTGEEALIHLQLPGSIEETVQDYILHPSMADAALQGIFIMNMDVATNEMAVPYRIDTIQFERKTETSMWAYVREETADNKTKYFDLFLYNENGELCTVMRKVEMKQFRTVDTDSIVLLEYRIATRKIELSETRKKDYAEKVVILCDCDEWLVDSIRDKLFLNELYLLKSSTSEDVDYLTECFSLLQKIIRERRTDQIFIQVVVPKHADKMRYSGWLPALRSAKLEIPNLGGQVLELDYLLPTGQICEYIKENCGLAEIQRVFYQDNQRFEVCLKENKVMKHENIPSIWQENGVYVIAGGAGGLGRILIQEMKQTLRRGKVILLGRSYHAADEFTQFEKPGFTVLYQQVDVTDKEAVKQVISKITKNNGRLNGIIYTAGLIQDSVIVKKTEAEFRKTVQSKVTGIKNLDEATEKVELDFFIIYSSIAGVLGNVGQIDYAMANAYADTFAKYRDNLVNEHKRFGVTVSINWPLWKNGGMLHQEHEQYIFEKRTGINPLSNASGMWCLHQSLWSGTGQVMYLQGKEEAIYELTKYYLHEEKKKKDVDNYINNNVHNVRLEQLIEDIRKGLISESDFEKALEEISNKGGI